MFLLQSQILVCGPGGKMPVFSFRQWSHFPDRSLQSGDAENIAALKLILTRMCGFFCF